jgi:hypothetical protein
MAIYSSAKSPTATGRHEEQTAARFQERFPKLAERTNQFSHQVEEKTRNTPGIAFAAAAGASILASGLIALFSKKKPAATFVGLWAPSILLMGIYSKLLKMERSRER